MRTSVGAQTPSPSQVPVDHAQASVHVSVRVPQCPQIEAAFAPGTQAPVSPAQALKSDQRPSPLHTRVCVPHLPHAVVSATPASQGPPASGVASAVASLPPSPLPPSSGESAYELPQPSADVETTRQRRAT